MPVDVAAQAVVVGQGMGHFKSELLGQSDAHGIAVIVNFPAGSAGQGAKVGRRGKTKDDLSE